VLVVLIIRVLVVLVNGSVVVVVKIPEVGVLTSVRVELR